MDFSSKEPFCRARISLLGLRALLLRSEQIALNLSGRGLGQLVYEAKIAGAFETWHAGAEPAVNFAVESAGRPGNGWAQNDVSHGFNEAHRIGLAHDRTFRNGGMAEECVFYFAGRDPHARNLHHVIRTAAIMEVALGVASKFVAGEHPAVTLGSRGGLGDLPIFGERAVTPYPKVSHFAVGDGRARVIENFCFVAGNFLAASSRLSLPRLR